MSDKRTRIGITFGDPAGVEFPNPSDSIKDRAALAIIKDAEDRGKLEPGGLIVEGTAGNVGIP